MLIGSLRVWFLSRVRLDNCTRLILPTALCIFFLSSYGDNLKTLEFIWECKFVQRHDVPAKAAQFHSNVMGREAARYVSRLTIFLSIAFILKRVIAFCLSFSGSKLDELDKRDQELLKRYQKSVEDFALIERYEIFAAAMRNHLSFSEDLMENSLRLRRELENARPRQKSKAEANTTPTEQDLFSQAKPQKPQKKWRARARSITPDFS